MILSHKLDWALMGLCTMAASVSSQAYTDGALDAQTTKQILCLSFGGIGSVASGYLGSVLFPIKGMTFRTCWIINFICGFMLAPVATYLVIARYSYLPIPITAFCTSFFLGAVGVKSLQYMLPKILKFYARAVGQSPQKDQSDDEKH